MIDNPMDVLQQFPIRKGKRQKESFRNTVQVYAKSLGYAANVEKGRFGAKNVLIGNPETAKYLVTAHYDTPAVMVLPNLITPCNPVTFIAYQFLIVGLFFAVAFAFGFGAGFLMNDASVAGTAAMTVYWALLLLMLLGPANKSNANDNTSGVVTVLETARALPVDQRDQVCFILFDLEEAGLIGSSSYAKKHKAEVENQIILNCDCVGDGDELMMFPTPRARKNAELMNTFRSITGKTGDKSLGIRERGFAYYPSDQRNFPIGFGIAAFRRSKWAGLYCDKIHTKKDTVLDKKNVSYLRDKLIELIGNAAK